MAAASNSFPGPGFARLYGMSYLSRTAVDRPLATPVVSSVVTSLGTDAGRPRAIRPWTHASYSRWRRAGLQSLAVAVVLAALLLAGSRQAGRPIEGAALLVPAALCWVVTGWMLLRRQR